MAATTLFLRVGTSTVAGTLPAAGTSVSASVPTKIATGGDTNRTLSLSSGASQTSLVVTTNASVSAQSALLARFISAPISAQTFGAQTPGLAGAASEQNAGSNFTPSHVIAIWRPSTGAVVGIIIDVGSSNPTGVEVGTTETAFSAHSLTNGSTAVTSQDGDVIVVEVWRTSFAQGAATAWTNTFFYDGTTTSSTTSNAANFSLGTSTIIFLGQGFGQAQAKIKATSQGFGQAQAKINAFGVQGYGQAQATIDVPFTGTAVSALTYRSTGTGTATGLINQIGKPAGLAVGDLMIAQIAWRINGTITEPTGTWTSKVSTSGGTTRSLNIFYKIATSSDVAATTFEFDCTASAAAYGAIHAFSSGYNASFPVDGGNISSNAAGTFTSGSITPTQPNEVPMVLAMAQNSDASPFSGEKIATLDPGSWTETIDNGDVSTSIALGAAYPIPRSSQSDTGNGSLVFTTSRANIVALIGIRTPGLVAAQAQAQIKAIGVQGFGQAQADVKATSLGFGQSQADIRATSNAFGQTQAQIVLSGSIPIGGYVSWFDASDLTTITSAANLVSQWADKGSGAHNLTGTGSAKPSTGLNTVHNLNVLTFDGTQTVLLGTPSITGVPYTVFVLVQNTDVGSAQRDVFNHDVSGSGDGRIYRDTSDNINAYSGSTLSTGQKWLQTPHVVSAVFNGASSKIAVDNGAATTGTTGAQTPNLSFWSVGNSNNIEYWKGYIGEIIVYNSALSDADRQAVEVYLVNKWFAKSGFAQAQAQIKAIGVSGFGQAQADIKAVSRGFAQAQADVKATSFGFAQSQADVKAVGRGFAQSQADIKAIGRGFGQANADIKATSLGFAQAQTDIKQTSLGFGQTQADIKATSSQFAQAQTSIKVTSQVYGQSQAGIKAVEYGFGQANADVKTTSLVFAQAQTDIKATSFGFAQSNADIKAVGYGFGQSQADIKATSWGFGQANADIKQTSRVFAQTQADIKVTTNVFGQAQADIKATSFGFGQTQADIKVTSYGFGQAQSDILVTSQSYAQAQADILVTAFRFAQAQADVLATGFGFGQANADILATSLGFGQAQARIEVSGQATTFDAFAQANAQIKATSQGYGQAQTDVLTTSQTFAQAQTSIRAVGFGFGQTQARILNVDFASAQAQAQIKQTYFGFGQSQAQIILKQYASGQAQADILVTSNVVAQAQADIRATNYQPAQAQAIIKQTYIITAQAQALIRVLHTVYAQAQASIIKTTTTFGQAQADILQTYTQTGNAQADIKVTVNESGQAQADIRQIYRAFGQTSAWIRSISSQFGLAQAFINRGEQFGQAQAFITQPHILKNLTISDTHSTKITVSDESLDGLTLTESRIKLKLSDSKSVTLTVKDEEAFGLTISDAQY